MRIFKHFNPHDICPICKTTDNKETLLIGIDGTEQGNIVEGRQVHLDCLNLRMNEEFIYQRLEKQC